MRHCATLALSAAACALFVAPAAAFDVNGFRARHKLPPLATSGPLGSAAYSHAQDLAARRRLDHDGFRRRVAAIVGGTAAENVLVGCADEACAIRVWSRSAGHRRNMLMRGVSAYGIASAKAADGRMYWVMELGN